MRSLARGLQAYLRNLPTLIAILAEKYEDSAREHKNAEARVVLQKLSKLRDPRNLLLVVGLAQLLELYCRASLQSQHYRRFPSQAWKVVISMREEVTKLRDKWTWFEEDLQYTGCEAPSKVVELLVEEARYRPKVTLPQARANPVQAEGEKAKDLFNEDGEAVRALAGEAILEVPLVWRARRGLYNGALGEDGRSGATRHLTEGDVREVVEELQSMAGDIVEAWEERQQQTSLDKASYAAFTEKFNWGEDQLKVEAEGMEAVVGMENTVKMRRKLEEVVGELGELQADKFDDIDSILEGYGSYMKFKTREEEERMVEEHETYEAWFKVRSCSISEKLFFGAGVWRSHRVSPPVRQTVPECTN